MKNFKGQLRVLALLIALAGVYFLTRNDMQVFAAYQPYIEGEDTSRWFLDFNEEFDEPVLNPRKFSDLYLPHWTDGVLGKANYELVDGSIKLKIDENQHGWRQGTKQQISSIQTGMRDGLHIWDKTLDIGAHYPAIDNYRTKYGYFELRAKAQKGGGIHSAWWMVGDQHQYDKAAEIDIFEILGKDIHDDKSKVWVTIHPWYDTVIRKQRLDYWVDGDISADYHIYGFEWTPKGMKWYFDGKLVRETQQSPDYKMYTLLGIYQSWGNIFSWQGPVDVSQPYPKSFDIDYFRVFKTRDMLDAERAEREQEAVLYKHQPGLSAIYGGDFTWNWYNQPGDLNDGRFDLTLQSKDDVQFPVHIYADFPQISTLNKMVIYTHYARGQGITDFDIEYLDPVDNQYKLVDSVRDYQWISNSDYVEEAVFKFPKPVAAKTLRIKILKANMQWRHFAINEIEIY